MDPLDRALLLWRQRPTMAHQALVDRASSSIAREPLTADQWATVEAAGDPADVPRLIEALALLDDRSACIARLLARPADPRILAALFELLETQHWPRRDIPDPAWRDVLAAVDATGNALHVPRLQAVFTQPRRVFSYPLERYAIAIIRRLAKRPAPADAESPATLELVAELDRLEQRRRDVEEQSLHLFDAVWDAPDDDAPRGVLADFFTELGDPRGEFIALQLAHHAGKLGAQGRKRAQKLLTRHKRAWTGAIAPLVFVPYARFERGFIVGCQLARRDDLVEAFGDHPAWSTVREFALHPITREQRGHRELVTKLRLRGAQLVDALARGIA